MEFLLSLSPKAKEKIASVKTPNKSVTYSDQVLSEDDTKWVTDMKEAIIEYLKQGLEGPYFNRMVETVLSRDKNWVRWKIENCPSIELPVMAPDMFVAARAQAGKLAATKRLRAAPLGSLALDFLGDEDEESALRRLKDPARYSLPELASLRRGIADDEFEIEMPANDETKAQAAEGKASKTWRALRIASKSRLAVFDRIEDDDKIDVVFEDKPVAEEEEAGARGNAEADHETAVVNGESSVFPDDRRPIVIVDAVACASSSSSAGPRSGVAGELIAKYPGTFARVPVHVTRRPREGEVDGSNCHFVDVQAFNVMRDGDQLLEFSGEGDESRGTSKRAVEGIVDRGRVPVMDLDRDVRFF
jgi:THO complex subunit 1